MSAEIAWLCPLLMVYTLSLPSSSNATSSGETSTVRLVGGAVPSEGRLEVLYNGTCTWGTVCGDFFDWREAFVVCRQLNYVGVLSVSASLFGAGDGTIWLDDVDCNGSEDSIFDCQHRGFGVHNCVHTEDIGIICDTQVGEEGAVRLAGGDSVSNGRVEIFHDGQWGTVCDRQWDLNDAMVVCQQLGFQGALGAPMRSHYGAGIGTIWLSGVSCTGSESRLDQCNHNGWGVASFCYHRISDASVQCEGDIPTPPPTAPPQVKPSLHTTTICEIAPSVTTVSRRTVLSSKKAPTTISKLASQDLMLPMQPTINRLASQNLMSPMQPTTISKLASSSSPTVILPTASDVGDNFSQMELILGLVALGCLLLTSAILLSIVITVCICRTKRSKSVRVEDFQSARGQSVDFPPIAGLVEGPGSADLDSEVVLTNTNTHKY